MSYKQKLQEINRTFGYVQNNPTKAKLFGHSMLKRFNDHLDADLFALLVKLNSLGFAEQLETLYDNFQKKAESLKEKTERQWRRRSSVYNTNRAFNVFNAYEEQVDKHAPTLIKATQLELVNRLEKLIDDDHTQFASKIDKKSRSSLKQTLKAYSRKHAIDRHNDTHHIDKTFDYVAQNPFKVVFFGQGVLKHFNDNLNPHLFEALYQMHLVGLHKELQKLQLQYQAKMKELETAAVKQWSEQAIAAHDANPKLSVPVVYENLSKLNHAALVEAKKEAMIELFWQLVVKNQQYMSEESGKRIKQSLNRYARQQALACRIELAHRQALYNEFGDKSLHKVYEFRNKSGYTAEETRQKASARNKKKWFKRIGVGIAITVGIGEALVAVVFAGLPLLVGALAIGIPAFLVNYYLLNGAAYSTIKEVFLGRFFKNQYGEEVSRGKKIAITAASAFVVAAGLCYGVLSFGSALSGLGGLMFGLGAAASVAAPPVALIVLAAVVATVTAVAITTLLYVSVADFIKNDRAQQLGRYYQRTGKEIAVHWKQGKYAYAVGRVFWEGCKALFVVGLTALVTLCSFGKFHVKTLNIMTGFFRSPSHTANVIGYAVSAMAAPVNSLFAACSMESCRRLIGTVATATGRMVVNSVRRLGNHYSETGVAITESWKQGNKARAVGKVLWEAVKVAFVPLVAVVGVCRKIKSAFTSKKSEEVSSIATYAHVKGAATLAVLSASVVANGQAQAGGMAKGTGIGSAAMQQKMFYAYYPGQFAYSAVPNYDSCHAACYAPVSAQPVAVAKRATDKALAGRQRELAGLYKRRVVAELNMRTAQDECKRPVSVPVVRTPSPLSSVEMSSGSDSDRSPSGDLSQPLLSAADKKAQLVEEKITQVEGDIVAATKKFEQAVELKRRQGLGLFNEAKSPVPPSAEQPSKPSAWTSKAALFGSLRGYTETDTLSVAQPSYGTAVAA
ncbi:MAG: hypothetical protein P1U40_07940 [Coxiellaceae bacterium]|nr:hypothetical protein [Coxiellaceae bacterium]